MFESAEVGHRIADREYKRAVIKLREDLLKAQYDLIARKSFQLIVLTGGVARPHTFQLIANHLDLHRLRKHV